MNYWEFMKMYKDSTDLKKVANVYDYDPCYMSFRKFVQGYHLAVALGLCSDDVVEFKKKFKVEIDMRLDAKREGLSYTDWSCKQDPFSYWYNLIWADVADGKINLKDVFAVIQSKKEEITKERTGNSYNPSNDTYTTGDGIGISSTRITAEDLKKYRMPGLSPDFVDTDEQEVFSW